MLRVVILGLGLLFVVTAAGAADLGATAPAKVPSVVAPNVPLGRQGGDTIASAIVVPALPFVDAGSTTGFANDYDEPCPYLGSLSPDVVYVYQPAWDVLVDVDLCGSAYDTKVYVWDSDQAVVACNDDYYTGPPCGTYVSRLPMVYLPGGQTYYIIVDGYGGDHGAYQLTIGDGGIWPVLCPPEGMPEGEPPLVDEYVDNWNGGCNTEGMPFQPIGGDTYGASILCGVGGWYHSGGDDFRDTDWFWLTMGTTGAIEIEAEADQSTYLYELWPQDCDEVGIVGMETVEPGEHVAMQIAAYAPGQVVWFWVGSTTYWSEWLTEYNYVIWFTGLESAVVVAPTAWGAVKALYE